MRDRLLLAVYLITVVAVTLIHHPAALGLLLTLALALTGPRAFTLLGRAAVAVLAVNVPLSGGYVLAAELAGGPWLMLILRLNLRVMLLTVLTLWITPRIDLRQAAGFSPSLRFLTVLVCSQIQRFGRLAADYRLAQRSRCPRPPGLRDRYRGAVRQTGALLERGNAGSTELVQGMQSRGFFDDRA